MSKCTIKDLPGDIRKAVPHYESNPTVVEIIKEAEAGEFHDFKNEKYVCGKVQVVQMLKDVKEPALEAIREAIINGDYDEDPDVEDRVNLKNSMVASGMPEDLAKKMFGI